MKKRIHVNQHVIRDNKAGQKPAPPLTVKTYKDNRRTFSVDVQGPSRVVYADACNVSPLSCGARVWIETDAPVLLDDGTVIQ